MPHRFFSSRLYFYSAAGRYAWLVFGALLLAGALLAAAGVWGLAKVAEWIVPASGRLATWGLGFFLAVVLPLSLVKSWRPVLAGAAGALADGFGLGTWLVSFLTLWKWAGFFTAPVILLPFLAAPLAVLRLAFLSDWSQAAAIAGAVILAGCIRRYAVWLRPRPAAGTGAAFSSIRQGNVIDVEVVAPDARPGDKLNLS